MVTRCHAGVQQIYYSGFWWRSWTQGCSHPSESTQPIEPGWLSLDLVLWCNVSCISKWTAKSQYNILLEGCTVAQHQHVSYGSFKSASSNQGGREALDNSEWQDVSHRAILGTPVATETADTWECKVTCHLTDRWHGERTHFEKFHLSIPGRTDISSQNRKKQKPETGLHHTAVKWSIRSQADKAGK